MPPGNQIGQNDGGGKMHLLHRIGLVDFAAIVAALAVSIGVLISDSDVVAGGQLPGIAMASIAAVLLFIGHVRYSWVILVVVGALDIVTLTWTASPIGLRPLLALALFQIVRRSQDRATIWYASFIAIVAASIGVHLDDEPFWFEWATDVAVLLLPIAAAEASRANQRRRAEAVDREVAERLQAERLRIAYDLHDIVAHSLSAVTVQSGIAAHRFDRDPTAAHDALVEINNVGRRSLDELRSLLGILRSDEPGPLRPMPSATTPLSELVAADGHPKEVNLTEEGGYPKGVADSAVLTVHRIVHECLVNVARHAGEVPVTVHLRHTDSGVHVTVTNEAPASPRAAAPGTGIGLVAIRERAELLGGSVQTEPTGDGGFMVRSFVPYQAGGLKG